MTMLLAFFMLRLAKLQFQFASDEGHNVYQKLSTIARIADFVSPAPTITLWKILLKKEKKSNKKTGNLF